MPSLPPDVTVLARGWLHGNVVVLPGAVIDTGYVSGSAASVAAVGPLDDIVLTHVHADHAGGVAALKARWPGATVWAHPAARRLVAAWDRVGLWLEDTGQQMPRFAVDRSLADEVVAGGRRWTVLETGGHATGGVSFFDPDGGVLVTGDALWEDGFGLLNPSYDGPGVFDAAADALGRLATVDAAVVIPGHGPPFSDLPRAIDRARSRLQYLAAHPDRVRAQVLRNLAGFLRLAHPEVDPDPLVARMRARLSSC